MASRGRPGLLIFLQTDPRIEGAEMLVKAKVGQERMIVPSFTGGGKPPHKTVIADNKGKKNLTCRALKEPGGAISGPLKLKRWCRA
jgi:hypothetical protein